MNNSGWYSVPNFIYNKVRPILGGKKNENTQENFINIYKSVYLDPHRDRNISHVTRSSQGGWGPLLQLQQSEIRDSRRVCSKLHGKPLEMHRMFLEPAM